MNREGVFLPMPSRDVAPAGDLLFAPPKSRQKALPCETAPAGCPAMLESRGRAELTSLRSVQTSVASQFLKRAAHAPRLSALLGGLEGEAPQTANSQAQQPGGGCISIPPSEPAEKHRALSPRAKLASRTDSRRLSEQSVAARVRRAGSRTEHRRAPRCEAKGRAVRGRFLCLLSCAHKKVSRPPGRNPGMGLATKQVLRKASKASRPC
jgi:hypothetical protein